MLHARSDRKIPTPHDPRTTRAFPHGFHAGCIRPRRDGLAPFISQVRHRATIVAVFLILALANVASAGPPEIDWLARYAGPDAGNSQASAVARDNQGNIYVTGNSSGSWWDLATVKYSPTGRELHVDRFNGAMGGDDVPWGMTVDASGNVYVVGYTDGNGQYNYDYLTVKYDSTLTRQWARTYAAPGNAGLDEAFAVAVDPSGNVYVTGDSNGGGTDHDYATIKYAPNGTQLWVRRYNGPGNQGDGANAIAVDADGNSYVTGISNKTAAGLNMDVATVKYSTLGIEQWVRRYDGPASGRDIGIRLVLDSSRNVYVTGASDGSGTRSDMLTIKYTQDGTLAWIQRYNGPGFSHDASLAIALASDGVCVTGYSSRLEGDTDYATISYSSAGDEQWVSSYNGPSDGYDEGQGIAVDASGNVYVTGYSDGGADLVNYDYATVKYDPNGAEQWRVRYNGPGNNIDVAAGILLDENANVIVSGWSTGTHLTDVDFATIQYRQADPSAVPAVRRASELRLLAAAPNPCRRATSIGLELPAPSGVDLTLFDAGGRAVRALLHGSLPSGSHSVALSTEGLEAGTYFYQLRAGENTRTGRLTIVR